MLTALDITHIYFYLLVFLATATRYTKKCELSVLSLLALLI